MKKNLANRIFLAALIPLLLAGCAQARPAQESSIQSTEPAEERSENWNEASHGDEADPNYAVVFPQDTVNRIDISLSADAWADLHGELEEQFGSQGSGEGGFGNRQPPQNRQPPLGTPNQAPGSQPLPGGSNVNPPPGNLQQPGGGMRGLDFGDTSYVSSTITFNGETWENVGFRYSGNSTLRTSWNSGPEKISFRLDFDEFEDKDPSIKNQRFYGFKQISFKSNAMDDSYLREKVTADIFREAGVISSQTAFYEVYIDFGEGARYFGLYTAVEIVDDTLIESQFEDDSGNVYKPEGNGAAFAAGTFDEASFEKQTNQDEADWSDIQAVFAALHSNLRTSDPAAWRAGLEAVFDVDAFLRWLAADTIIQNWDTYGGMAHNYYLYTDPTDGLVTWIPWDNNMALSASGINPGGGEMGPGGGGRGGMGRGVRDLDLASVSDQWPLIRFLIDDPTYLEKYNQYLEEIIQGAFEPDQLEATYRKYHDLIAPSVEKEEPGYTQVESITAFDQALDELIQHARDRYDAVRAYLAGN